MSGLYHRARWALISSGQYCRASEKGGYAGDSVRYFYEYLRQSLPTTSEAVWGTLFSTWVKWRLREDKWPLISDRGGSRLWLPFKGSRLLQCPCAHYTCICVGTCEWVYECEQVLVCKYALRFCRHWWAETKAFCPREEQSKRVAMFPFLSLAVVSQRTLTWRSDGFHISFPKDWFRLLCQEWLKGKARWSAIPGLQEQPLS